MATANSAALPAPAVPMAKVATGTPREIIDKIHRDTVKALEAPEIKSRFEGLGMAPVGNSPADFAKAIREETETWGKIVRERKLIVE